MKELNDPDIFNILGYGFPDNPEELTAFNNAYANYTFKGNPGAIDADKIFSSVFRLEAKATNVDYHKRTVLAAEIVYRLHNEWSLGHIKLQKLLFLCQKVGNMNLHTNFLKQAMGPYDPQLMRSLDSQFKKNKWFEFNREAKPKYCLLEKAGEHRIWFDRYFSNHQTEIDFLITSFQKKKSSETELVATIYACWEEIKTNYEIFSDNLIIRRVYEWSDHKQKFSEKEITECLKWMTGVGIHPK